MRLFLVGLATVVAACTGAMGYLPATMSEGDRAAQQAAFVANLADPASVQTQRVQVFAAPNGNRMICGQINAKNAFGGYTGFQPFIVSTIATVDYSNPAVRPIFATGPEAMIDCGGAGYR